MCHLTRLVHYPTLLRRFRLSHKVIHKAIHSVRSAVVVEDINLVFKIIDSSDFSRVEPIPKGPNSPFRHIEEL